jgi:hypothetical protein
MFSNALLNAIQGKGWLYSVDFDNDTNPIGLELETCSPAGEDFLVYLYGSNDDEILHSLYEYAEDFDPEEHALSCVDMREAPGIRTLLHDADEMAEELNSLYEHLSNAVKK